MHSGLPKRDGKPNTAKRGQATNTRQAKPWQACCQRQKKGAATDFAPFLHGKSPQACCVATCCSEGTPAAQQGAGKGGSSTIQRACAAQGLHGFAMFQTLDSVHTHTETHKHT